MKHYADDGQPLACRQCDSENLRDVVTDTLDTGAGGGLVCEFEVRCRECDALCGYWAYGSYDPAFWVPGL